MTPAPMDEKLAREIFSRGQAITLAKDKPYTLGEIAEDTLTRQREFSEAKGYLQALEDERKRVASVVQIAQGVLTALNVGNVASESPLHLKLRETMIAYRANQ